MSKNSSSGFSFLIIGLLLGAISVYFYLENNKTPPAKAKVSNSSASVNTIDGLYVFINSNPTKTVTDLGTYQTDIAQTINELFSFKGKNVWDKISEVGKTFAFNQKIRENISKIKQQYPDAEAVIFDSRLDKCRVVKFK